MISSKKVSAPCRGSGTCRHLENKEIWLVTAHALAAVISTVLGPVFI